MCAQDARICGQNLPRQVVKNHLQIYVKAEQNLQISEQKRVQITDFKKKKITYTYKMIFLGVSAKNYFESVHESYVGSI